MSASATVRAARPADLPRIWELLNGLAEYERWQEYVTGTPEQLGVLLFGPSPIGEALVAERDGAIVGYALFYVRLSSFRTRTRLWLEDLFVEPGERGAGTGRALLAVLAAICAERGHDEVALHVLDWNAPSIAFSERLGGRRVATDVYTYAFDAAALATLATGND